MLDQVGIDPYLHGRPAAPGVLRRPVPAHQHRPRPGAQAEAAGVRRGRLRPRRVGPGPDPQPARGPQAASTTSPILFIAHDLAVVKNVSDRVAVMYLGRLCEIAPSDLLYEAPAHHYTAALLASAVEPDPEAARTSAALLGRAPEPDQPAVGLPLPHPLPAGRGPLRRGGPRDAPDRPRPPGGLPLPHRELSATRRAVTDARWSSSPPLRSSPTFTTTGPSSGPRSSSRGSTPAPPYGATRGSTGRPPTWSLANGVWDTVHHAEAFFAWLDRLTRSGRPGGQLPGHAPLEHRQALPAGPRAGRCPHGADAVGGTGPGPDRTPPRWPSPPASWS